MILDVCVKCDYLMPSADGHSTKGFCEKEKCYCELTKCIMEKAIKEYIDSHAV